MKFTPYIAACIVTFVAAVPLAQNEGGNGALAAREVFGEDLSLATHVAFEQRDDTYGQVFARDAAPKGKKKSPPPKSNITGYLIDCTKEGDMCKQLDGKIDTLNKGDKKQKNIRKAKTVRKHKGKGKGKGKGKDHGKGKGKDAHKDKPHHLSDMLKKAGPKNNDPKNNDPKKPDDKNNKPKRDEMYDIVAREIVNEFLERDVDFSRYHLATRDAEADAFDDGMWYPGKYEPVQGGAAASAPAAAAAPVASDADILDARDAEPEAFDNGMWWPGKYEPVQGGAAAAAPAPAAPAAASLEDSAGLDGRDAEPEAFDDGMWYPGKYEPVQGGGQAAASSAAPEDDLAVLDARDAEPEAFDDGMWYPGKYEPVQGGAAAATPAQTGAGGNAGAEDAAPLDARGIMELKHAKPFLDALDDAFDN